MRVLQDTIHCSHFSPWQEEEGAWQMAVLLLDTAEGHWDEAVVNGAQKSMEKLWFHLRAYPTMNPGPGRGSAGRKWERRDLRRKCQGSHFLIGLFLAAGDSGSVTARWSFGGGFLRNGNVPTRTISLTVLSPVGNSYPMTSPSKLDGIYICSEVVFYFWQLPHCWLDISETRPFRFSEARKAADKTNSELSSSALLTWQCFLSTLLFPPLLILEQFWCTWK